MNTSAHDFVTVDMRGLKAALVARAHADRVSVSALVRRAVEREFGVAGASDDSAEETVLRASADAATETVRLSIRLTLGEAERLIAGARAAGMSRGAFLAGLVAGIPVLAAGSSRAEHLAALTSSCAELSNLSRDLRHLAALLKQGAVRPALEYRERLVSLDGDVRGHLAKAAHLLSELRPQAMRSDHLTHSTR